MAKIRVYELARDLNMKNKELLDKIEELNITVRSHMSSLDDDTVAEIKASLRDKKKPGGLEVTRVKPTVIRRRKRASDQAETRWKAMSKRKPPCPNRSRCRSPSSNPKALGSRNLLRNPTISSSGRPPSKPMSINGRKPSKSPKNSLAPSEVEQEKPVEETATNGHAEPEKADSAEKPVEQPKASEAKKRRKKEKEERRIRRKDHQQARTAQARTAYARRSSAGKRRS